MSSNLISSAVVNLEIEENIAKVTLNNPPVNALSKDVRIGLLEAIHTASENKDIRVIAISSALPTFSAGADITEFGNKGDLTPMLPKVLDEIEQCAIPIVAVVFGAAFGGGLELALACHYRVTKTGNKVGLPEVHLGILPGAGGTQRLPRLCDTKTALDTIVKGKPVAVSKLGSVFDLIVEANTSFEHQVSTFLQNIITNTLPPKPVGNIALELNEKTRAFFEEYQQGTLKMTKGFFAPNQCVEAVKAAYELSFNEGIAKESELFIECMSTPQARAQQHFFFAERAASHIDGLAKSTKTRPIKKVAVIGAGTMGGGIAMNFANVGIPVVILEMKQDALDKGLSIIEKNYANSAKKGKLTAEDVTHRMSLISGTTDYDSLGDVDLVIEAVFEKMEVKKSVFGQLDKVCKPGAILASNTSTLDLNEIAQSTSRPHDVIGLHFFSPANVMKLLEIVRGDDTSDEVIKTCMELAKKIKKVGVLVGVCFGFVGNRMIEPYGREANRLLLEGAAPEQVDKVLTDFGLPMGPFTMGDMAGQDIGYFVRQSRKAFIKHDPSYCIVADKLVEEGRVGLKCGKGAYLYETGSRQPISDPYVREVSKNLANELGIEQREITDQEILERILFPLINEGAEILSEGIATKSSDIDVIYVYGYGFPVFRGGPMKYADEIGLDVVKERMQFYHDTLGKHGKNWFKPAKLLVELADQQKKFN